MPKEWLAKQLEQASNEVKKWPEWKKVELQLATEEVKVMTDDVVERVARAIADAADKDMDDGLWSKECRRDAKAALAALKPGDDLGEGNFVAGPDLRTVGAIQRTERRAAEAMRERCAATAKRHKGSAAQKRRNKGQTFRDMEDGTVVEILAEERGEDIAAEMIEAAIRLEVEE